MPFYDINPIDNATELTTTFSVREHVTGILVGQMSYRVFRKNVFFSQFTVTPHWPIAYIALRDLQSSQRNTSAQSLLLAGNFLYNQ